jgi:hypothetical protein
MKLTYVLGLNLLISSAMAGPIYSTSCEGARDIRIPVKSAGFFMSNDCTKAYVLPPSKGTTTVVGKTVGDLSRCDEIPQFSKSLKKVNQEITKVLAAKPDDQAVKTLFEQRKFIIDQYSDLSRTLGASLELNFSNGIDENIQAFKNLNPDTDITFVPVALKNVKLAWNQSNNFDPDMQVAFNQSIPLPDMNAIGAGSFDARLDLSLIGACPLTDVYSHQMPNRIKVKDVAGIITPNVVYQYDLGATYKYHAEYNLASLASKIREVSTKGGLFKTSSMSTLIETAESSGWFKFSMECDDARVCEQAKTETALSIKLRLVKEVFDDISIAKIGSSLSNTNAPTPGRDGASAASDALKKCPNVYCQAAAVVLDVGDSIFGGTNKTDAFISKNNHMAVEDVTESRPVSFTGMMGFGQ